MKTIYHLAINWPDQEENEIVHFDKEWKVQQVIDYIQETEQATGIECPMALAYTEVE